MWDYLDGLMHRDIALLVLVAFVAGLASGYLMTFVRATL